MNTILGFYITYGLSDYNFRAATLSRSYLTVKGIILQSLNCSNKTNTPKLAIVPIRDRYTGGRTLTNKKL